MHGKAVILMVLCIDMGNTSIKACVFDTQANEKVLSLALTTDLNKTSDEYCVMLKAIFEMKSFDTLSIDGIIIGSVVPQLTPVISKAVKDIFDIEAIIVGPGVKTSLNIKTDNPAEVGADIVANAVYAISEGLTPAVIVDFGTATTIVSIDADKKLTDVFILPGLYSSYKALTHEAAAIPSVPLYTPKSFSGKNTASSVNAGIVYSNAFAVDSFINRIAAKDGSTSLLATGSAANIVLPLCENALTFREDLTCEGLYRISLKNRT